MSSLAHVMFLCTGGAYYVPYSFLLISNKLFKAGGGGDAQAGRSSSFMHLSCPSRAIKFLYSPAHLPHSMGHETFLVGSCTLKYLCTYDLCSPVYNVLDVCISVTWAREGVGPWKSRVFGPQMALAFQLDAITQGQKTLDFQDPTLWIIGA